MTSRPRSQTCWTCTTHASRCVADATTLARKYLPLNAPELALVDNTRAAVADLHATPDLIDTRASFERFDVAQRQLTEAISQLMIACEGVHRLNADARFHIVQSRLASSAGQIALARERYDSAARRYNATLHGFPLDPPEAIHAAPDKPTFSVRDGSPVHRHPRTDFGALRGSLRVLPLRPRLRVCPATGTSSPCRSTSVDLDQSKHPWPHESTEVIPQGASHDPSHESRCRSSIWRAP